MARILVCYDQTEQTMQMAYYKKEIRPTLVQAGHDVQLTTHTAALEHLKHFRADILLLLIPRKGSSCWEVARSLRSTQNLKNPLPYILMVIAWGPDDSPNDPAYYVQSEYAELYDEYYNGFWADGEIARWVDDFLVRKQVG